MKTALASVFAAAAILTVPAHAIEITTNADADVLAAAVAGGAGLTVTGATLSHQATNGEVSTGTYTNAAGTYNNVGSGIVLSTGSVTDYNTGPNNFSGNQTVYAVAATEEQQDLLFPISGQLVHQDVTQLDITFTSTTGEVFFNVVFGSEEFDEFVGSTFIDAFGIYLNDTNIAFLAGEPINIDHPSMQFLSGTELDGILTPPPGTGGNPIVTFSGTASTTESNTLTFIVADSGDARLDTTVFISSLAGVAPIPQQDLPEPGSLLLMSLALAGLAGLRRSRS